MKYKIVVAMSGGVDSSTVAAMLLQKGHEVIGVTLDFKIPCSKVAIRDAQKIAKKLNIEHHVIDCEKSFKKDVVHYFAETYVKGQTPNPCARCNRLVKFAELIKFMHVVKADCIATGHYAKIVKSKGIYKLYKGSDKIKDQSYFLGFLKYDYLQYIKFPLEGMNKSEVRKFAKKLRLHVAEKSDSQDVCFVDKDYKEVIEKYYPKSFKEGDIVHVNGKKLGEHNGIINYTIGQRRGLNIGYTEPLYVVRIDSEKNVVYVGSESDLYSDKIKLKNLNLLDLAFESDVEYKLTVRLRSTHEGEKAKVVFKKDKKTAKVELMKLSRAITKGQLCVFYDRAKVIGSGWII